MIECFFIKIAISIVVLITSIVLYIVVKFYDNQERKIYIVSNTSDVLFGNLKVYCFAVLLTVYCYIAYKSYYFFKEHEVKGKIDVVVKLTGRQWYWEVKYLEDNISFNTLNDGMVLTLPVNQKISLLVTSQDVIHGLFVPDLRINIEGIKGKINEKRMIFDKVGKYYGECNVLCGIGHSKMPIILNIVTEKQYKIWSSNVNVK